MSNIIYNIIVLTACWALVTGAGVYITYFDQPEEMARLEKAEKVSQMKEAELTSLIAEEGTSKERAEEIVRRWRSRYKIIPQKLESPEVIGHLNGLSQSGFKNFDITFAGARNHQDLRSYAFGITGRGYFNDLYRVVWELENSRNFYRVRDLQLDHIDLVTRDSDTQADRLEVMVSFTMKMDAYFGGAEGLSAETAIAENGEGGLPIGTPDGVPTLPSHVLPDMKPAMNPFYPVIMEVIPPNTYGHLDVENAILISIVGGQAIFQDKEKNFHALGVGDEVYLGQIVVIDPTKDRVLIRMNKGGIIDEVELFLQTDKLYRQAMGASRLTPLEQ